MKATVIAILALFVTGCVSIAKPVSHIHENVSLIVENQRELARSVPPDSEIGRQLALDNWRLEKLVLPITEQLRRIEGPVAVDTPRGPQDHERLIDYNRDLDDLKADIDHSAGSPLQFNQAGGLWSTVRGLLVPGGLFGGPLATAVGLYLKERRRSKTYRHQRDGGIAALGRLRNRSPELDEIVKTETSQDPMLKAGYRDYREWGGRNEDALREQMQRLSGRG
jgi:hypothetical protein